MSAANLGPVTTLLLAIVGERADANPSPSNVSCNARTFLDDTTVQRREINTKLPPVDRWPRSLGPFVMLVLTMRRRSPAADCDKRGDAALPRGAQFVVRCSSR